MQLSVRRFNRRCRSRTATRAYDEAGRLSARKVQAGTVQDIITQQYGYDSLDRLSQIRYIKAQGTAGEQLIEQIDYEYDAAGRRTSKTTLNNNGAGGAETPMTASFDAGNRMTGITLNPNTANAKTYSLGYDANGNLTQKQNTTDAADKTLYTWDADNRLSRIEQGGTNPLTATFSYDAMGRRIQSSITKTGQPTATVQYLYEGAQALGEIRDGKLSHRLLTGLSLDETIARIALTTAGAKDQAASRIFLTDALNSVIAQMSDSDDSTLQTSYAYSPYGASTTVGTDPANNPIQYTSRENDGTGLYYYRARYYDPVLGRFVSEDPIGLLGGMNMHGYVGGNPVSFADPEGLQHDARPRRPNFPEWAQPTQPRRNCATADCAAGTSQPTDNCTCVENCKAKLESDPDRPVGAVCTFLAEQMTKSKSLGAVLGALVGEYCKGADKTFTCNAECSEFCRGKTSCNPYPSK